MKALVILILTMSAITLPVARSQEIVNPELRVLEALYEAKVAEQVTAPYEAAVKDLKSKYAAALGRSLETAQNAGNLPEALAFKSEKERIDQGDDVPATDDAALPESLKKFRVTYRDSSGRLDQERKAKHKALAAVQVKELTDFSIKLTKAGKLEEAQSVQTKASAVAADAELAAAPAAPATTPATAPVKTTDNTRANDVFARQIDGTDWKWAGRSYILTFGKDGKVKMADWDRKGVVTGWTVIKPGQVELKILSGRTTKLTATLLFDDKRKFFTGTDFDGSPLPESPRSR